MMKKKVANPPAKDKWGKKAMAGGFTTIPHVLFEKGSEHGLSAYEQLILLHLISYWWSSKSPVFPSHKTLSEKTGISTRTIGRNLKSLADKGWIKTKKRFNASSTYDLGGLSKKVELMIG